MKTDQDDIDGLMVRTHRPYRRVSWIRADIELAAYSVFMAGLGAAVALLARGC